MVYTPKEAHYRSKGFDFAAAPIRISDLSNWLPEEELSIAAFRAIESNHDNNHYALIAVPRMYKDAPQGLIQAKSYIVGTSEEDRVSCKLIKTAAYAPGQRFGRVLLAHDILSATQDPTINTYELKTNHPKIKELVALFGVTLNTTGKKKGVEETAVIDFTEDEERERIRKHASLWLSNFRIN